jgi:hypothetical protein
VLTYVEKKNQSSFHSTNIGYPYLAIKELSKFCTKGCTLRV